MTDFRIDSDACLEGYVDYTDTAHDELSQSERVHDAQRTCEDQNDIVIEHNASGDTYDSQRDIIRINGRIVPLTSTQVQGRLRQIGITSSDFLRIPLSRLSDYAHARHDTLDLVHDIERLGRNNHPSTAAVTHAGQMHASINVYLDEHLQNFSSIADESHLTGARHLLEQQIEPHLRNAYPRMIALARSAAQEGDVSGMTDYLDAARLLAERLHLPYNQNLPRESVFREAHRREISQEMSSMARDSSLAIDAVTHDLSRIEHWRNEYVDQGFGNAASFNRTFAAQITSIRQRGEEALDGAIPALFAPGNTLEDMDRHYRDLLTLAGLLGHQLPDILASRNGELVQLYTAAYDCERTGFSRFADQITTALLRRGTLPDDRYDHFFAGFRLCNAPITIAENTPNIPQDRTSLRTHIAHEFGRIRTAATACIQDSTTTPEYRQACEAVIRGTNLCQ